MAQLEYLGIPKQLMLPLVQKQLPALQPWPGRSAAWPSHPKAHRQRSVCRARVEADVEVHWLQRPVRSFCALILSLLVIFEPSSQTLSQTLPEPATTSPSLQPNVLPLEQVPSKEKRGKKGPSSNLPNAQLAERMLHFDRDAFTDEAWEGMKGVLQYARYVDGLKVAESEPGCEQCEDNRLILEKAWQVVSSEFFDPHGEFSQAKWVAALKSTLQEAGGCLHTKRELYATAQNMMQTLHDKYSEFLPPAQFRRALRRPQPAERDYLAAQYTGTGLQIGSKAPAGGWLVVGPLAGSAAEHGGILPGERLLEINGYSMEDMTHLEVESCMRGPSGSVAVLTIAGPAADSPHRLVDLERRSLPQPPLQLATVHASDGIPLSYIRLLYFSHETTRALTDALQQGDHGEAAGFILDLRNNPGGVFEEAMASAALLLSHGCQIAATVRAGAADVVDAVFRTGALPVEVFPGQPQERLTAKPAVVVVNAASASASEVFAGALHDNHRAALIGERTFGKGVVQYYFPMGDGSGVKATVAKYLTPNGYDITRAGGLSPDLKCNDYPHAGDPSAQNDSCISTAVQLLHEQAPVM